MLKEDVRLASSWWRRGSSAGLEVVVIAHVGETLEQNTEESLRVRDANDRPTAIISNNDNLMLDGLLFLFLLLKSLIYEKYFSQVGNLVEPII